MPLSQSTMLLLLETNSLLKYELMLPEEDNNTQKVKRKRRKVGIGEYAKLKQDPEKFYEYAHMDIKVFQYILSCIKDKLSSNWLYYPNQYKSTTDEDDLLVTIRYMATGMRIKDLAKTIGLGHTYTSRIIKSTLDAIWSTLHETHLKPPTPDEMPEAADKFYAKWRFPNAVGAIGAKYVPTRSMKIRVNSGEKALRKNSIILTAVADADFRFSAVGLSTGTSNQRLNTFDHIYSTAGFRELPGSSDKMPYVLLGNDCFPLKTHLLRPFHERYSYRMHRKPFANYNNRLTAARVAVEAAFQILTERFEVFKKPISFSRNETVSTGLIVRTGCLLHNIVKDIDGDSDPYFRDIGKDAEGTLNLYMVKKKFGAYCNRSSAIALQVRELFRVYML